MEIKYTTDGKKVVVIGNLNSQEKIVQEIFIVNNQEVPSGENFVVKSLHDAPAISWKEKSLKDIEDKYESKRQQYTDHLDRLTKEYRTKSAELKQKLEYAGAVLKNVSPDSFQMLVDLLTGNIKWVVVTGYDPELLAWDQFNTMYEDQLRLLSIFGRDDGSFTYSRGYYSDYSGGSKNFMPFNNYEDAFELFKSEVLKRGINDSTIVLAKKHNIIFPEVDIAAFREAKTKVLLSNIETYKKSIDTWEAAIQKFNDNPLSL
jgi:hypothetical protein